MKREFYSEKCPHCYVKVWFYTLPEVVVSQDEQIKMVRDPLSEHIKKDHADTTL